MLRRPAVPIALVLGFIAVVFHAACGPPLDERQVSARLVEQLHLQTDQLRVLEITREQSPVVTIEYAGVRTAIRFRRQDGVWVIDAVGQNGRWEPADRAVPVLAHDLTAKARARWIESAMPRYARTLKLLIGWTELISTDCTNLPTSQKALVDLHAAWHRTLFPNRGGEFHNFDLFIRDAWWKLFRLALTPDRIEVESGGADGRLDTADDVRLVFVRRSVRADVTACTPRYTMPAIVADTLGSANAPKEWNCTELVSALKKAELLELVSDRE